MPLKRVEGAGPVSRLPQVVVPVLVPECLLSFLFGYGHSHSARKIEARPDLRVDVEPAFEKDRHQEHDHECLEEVSSTNDQGQSENEDGQQAFDGQDTDPEVGRAVGD